MDFNTTRNSIRYRFFKAIALVLLAGTVVLTLLVAVIEGINQQALLTNKGKGLAQYVAKLSIDPLIMDDSAQLDSIVNEARYDEDILYIVITDKTGVIRTSQFASINYSSPLITPHKEKLSNLEELNELIKYIKANESSVELTVPMITGTETIGSVVLCISKDKISKNILKTVVFIIVVNSAIACILGSILFFVSRQMILDPVSALAEASRELAKGDLTTRLSITAVGEMQQLVSSFNKMAEDLEQTTVSKEYFNNIFKSLTEALLLVSPDGIVEDANHAAYTLLGYAPGALSGIHTDAIFNADFLNSAKHEEGIQVESSCRRNDGSEIPVFFTTSVLRGANGELEGIVCTALDISELERRKLALESANKELEAFCYSVSHDLRAPLRHIDGYVDLLVSRCRSDLNEKGIRYLDTIAASARQMGTLIDDLLQFSRTGRAEMRSEQIEMNQVVRESMKQLQDTFPDRAIEWIIPDLPRVRADYALIRQVWANLLGNAAKYSQTRENARIEISSRRENREIIFAVSDNGVGFDMQYANKLFGVFQRLHSQEQFEGTGIGLATVQRIVVRHGGRVWAEAELDKGATFYFSLPE